MDIRQYNKSAWDHQVSIKNQWTVPVSDQQIAQAKLGQWQLVLTPQKHVPQNWFGNVSGKKILCLASGGGQQGPILAAAGATVTVLDNSPKQLQQDMQVAKRHQLNLTTIEGDMRDLSHFEDCSFDLIFHPCSNCFVPDITPVWQECFRVLKNNGSLLAGFINPCYFIFDEEKQNEGELVVKYTLPYSDITSLTETELAKLKSANEPLVFSHSLDEQIGEQINVGFVITGFFEDTWPQGMLSEYLPTFVATKATKLQHYTEL